MDYLINSFNVYVLLVSAFRHLQVLYIICFSMHALVTNNYIKYYVVIDYKIIKIIIAQ
jgi:hypothetical protein